MIGVVAAGVRVRDSGVTGVGWVPVAGSVTGVTTVDGKTSRPRGSDCRGSPSSTGAIDVPGLVASALGAALRSGSVTDVPGRGDVPGLVTLVPGVAIPGLVAVTGRPTVVPGLVAVDAGAGAMAGFRPFGPDACGTVCAITAVAANPA